MMRTLPHRSIHTQFHSSFYSWFYSSFYSWDVASEQSGSTSKKELRQRFRFERSQRNLGGDWLHLLNADEIKNANVIASYISYGDEPTTSGLNNAILESGRKLLVPRTDTSGAITWIIWKADSTLEKPAKWAWKKSAFAQPLGDPYLGSIDVVITPALRVDRNGVRLGQGGGSYDRALIEPDARNAWKVALLHDEELTSEALPQEPHDVLVDAVALPDIVVRFKRN